MRLCELFVACNGHITFTITSNAKKQPRPFTLPSPDSYDVENKEESEDSTGGVKVLKSIPHKDVVKKVAELKENQEEYDLKDPELIKFNNDLVEILTPDNVSAIN